jgi:hypothetical protein
VAQLVAFFPLLVWPTHPFFHARTLKTTARDALLIVAVILCVILALCTVDTIMLRLLAA